jgi:acyl carrier protein
MIKPIEELDITVAPPILGIDSLVAIEVRNWLCQRLGIEISLLEIMGAKKRASRLVVK